MKKFITLTLALMLALTVFSLSTIAEVQKYGDIGRLSKLNITEDELNDVLKDIMASGPCNKYVFYDTMTDMIMALLRGDIVVLETDRNTVRYIASRNDNILEKPPYHNPNMLLFAMLLREDDVDLRDQLSACIAEMNEDGTIDAMKQTYIEDVITGEDPEPVEVQEFPGARAIRVAVTGDRPPMDYVSAGGEPLGNRKATGGEHRDGQRDLRGQGYRACDRRLRHRLLDGNWGFRELGRRSFRGSTRKHRCDRALHVRFSVAGGARRLSSAGYRAPLER